MGRDFARMRLGTRRARPAVVLAVVLALGAGIGTALRDDDQAGVRAFQRGYAAALATQQDADLAGRVEYAARRGPDGLADLYRDVRRSTDASRAALERLRAPAGFGKDVTELARLLEQQSAALERLIAATTSQDRTALAGATHALARTAAQASALRSRIQLRLAGAKAS